MEGFMKEFNLTDFPQFQSSPGIPDEVAFGEEFLQERLEIGFVSAENLKFQVLILA
jgi:hypothetical protein